MLMRTVRVVLALCVSSVVLAAVAHANPAGITWTSQSSATDSNWASVTYGNGLFVAVSNGSGDVMTSPNGTTWTSQTPATDNPWQSVTYGNELFVAVSSGGDSDQVMTSSDGINWDGHDLVPTAKNNWNSVTYGNELFVAVSSTGSGNRVMTSPNGTTWTSQTSAANNNWLSVTYGNELFVAVSDSGSGNRVMTSPDGITWTSRTSAANNNWNSVTYGNGLFVAVSGSGTGNRVMTSPDGITWTSQASAVDSFWRSVTYGDGLFVAVSDTQVMTSPDGATWTRGTPAATNSWRSVTYGNELFVAVGAGGTGNRVMTGVVFSDGSSASPITTPQTFELSLTPNDGTVCRNSSQSGTVGTWVTLPGANDCRPPATRPNAKLLGWATSPDFPIVIAKRQVDNGWGAYETFDGGGRITGVFIPAGGSTLVSAPGTLYTIWSE